METKLPHTRSDGGRYWLYWRGNMNPINPETDGYCGGASCASEIAAAVAAISGRWAIEVLEGLHFAGGASRFRDLQRRVGAISSKELTRQLGTLAAHGIVRRVERPPRNVSYELTASGRELMHRAQALGEWVRRREAAPGPTRHEGRALWLDPILAANPQAR
jgi:DNA-binding HxlR family transcriptional regulator